MVSASALVISFLVIAAIVGIIVGVVVGTKKDDKGSSGGGSSGVTYNITTSSADGTAAYIISGTDKNGTVSGSNQPITLNVGNTLKITNNMSSHPLYIKTTQGDGTSNQVTNPIATGQRAINGSTVTWTPSTAGTYYYQCSLHAAMMDK